MNAAEHLKACNNRVGHCGQCVTTAWERRDMRKKEGKREKVRGYPYKSIRHINTYMTYTHIYIYVYT